MMIFWVGSFGSIMNSGGLKVPAKGWNCEVQATGFEEAFRRFTLHV